MAAYFAKSIQQRLCCAAGGILLLLACSPTAGYAAEVIVQLRDGRIVSGEVDERTNDGQLWLRAVETSILLRSSFDWNDVVLATHDGKTLDAAELRQLAPQVKSKVDLQRFHPPQQEEIEPPPAAIPPGPLQPPVLPPQALRVASVEIHAAVANWDNDPEDDGLLVTVIPLTTNGLVRPIDGLLNLKLFGRITEPSLKRPHFPELTRGTLRVRAADFGPDGAVYKFRFRNFHPEKNLDVDVFGLLTGRLVVPGQGTFDASDANVRLRRISRFRDRLQFNSGRRFLPAENPRRLP